MIFKSNKLFLLAGILTSFLVIVQGCVSKSNQQKEKYRETKSLMGTFIHLDVCLEQENANNVQPAYKEAWDRLIEISWRMNSLDERSDVAKINNSKQQSVAIKQDTYHVIERSLFFNRLTEGAFDISVWPLMELWTNSSNKNLNPQLEEIETIKKQVGSKYVKILSDHHVKVLNENTKIDLGGIAKGYAIDEVAQIFRSHGIYNFYIDAGGDIYAGGRNCENELWRIGIRDPRDTSKIIDIVQVSDKAVTTSGDYERHYLINGVKWSHIINPNTGYPQKDVISATVIAPKAIEADALSTALCVLGISKGNKLINNLSQAHASLIIVKQETDQIIKYSSRQYSSFQTQ